MRISDWSSDVCSSDLRDLARPARDQRPRLGNQIGEGPARLGAARIGDDAIGAVFVAAFLHGPEGGGALAAGADRQSVVSGKSGSGRGDLGGSRNIKNKNQTTTKSR